MGNPLVRFCEGLGGNWEYRELPCLLDSVPLYAGWIKAKEMIWLIKRWKSTEGSCEVI
jgi:hypothetical protein